MNVTFYKARESRTINVPPGSTLDRVRTSLGSYIAPADRFLSFDDIEEKYFNLSLDVEKKVTIEKILRRNGEADKITIAVGGEVSRDFSGIRTSWFTYESTMQMQMKLNQGSAEIKAANAGKFEPYMIDQVRSVNRDAVKAYTRAIICEKGSVIQFNVQSWAAAGFGMQVRTGNSIISEGIFALAGDHLNRPIRLDVSRYSSSAAKTIVIDDLPSLANITGLNTDDVFQFAEVRVKTWLMSGYTQGGKRYASDATPPLNKSGRSSNTAVVLADLVEPGAPRQGDIVSDVKYSIISDIKQDEGYVLGDISFLLMVFKDKAAAERTIKVINGGI